MAEFIYNEVQLVQPGSAAILNTAIGCPRRNVIHRAGSGILTLRGIVNNPCANYARYRVAYDGNIAVPTGATETYEDYENMSGRRGRAANGQYISRDQSSQSYADGYSRGYAEGRSQAESRDMSRHYMNDMPPYDFRVRY